MITNTTNLKRFNILGDSKAVNQLSVWIHTIAPLPDHVLITGERGTGKELTANAIHKLSHCKGGEFITIDCSTLHQSTLEASLFGYERGAFTGAVNKRIGFIESADGGTLFLDEISTLPLTVQCRFLRFLEEGTITRIGSAKPKKVRVRVIAASNRNLQEDVKMNHFLPDLFDRINVFQITTPPLRERGNDILILLDAFLGKDYQRVTDEAKEFLLQYPFPGNIRELRHLCRRISVFYPDQPITINKVQTQLNQDTSNVTHPVKELSRTGS